VLTSDEAITVGVRTYRELYPEGMIPKALEDSGVLNAIPGREETTVLVAYFLRHEREPFILFKAVVDHHGGQVAVETAADWSSLIGKELDEAEMVT